MKRWKLLWIVLVLMGCEQYASKQTSAPPDCKKLYTYIIKNAHMRYLLAVKASHQQDTFRIVMSNYALRVLVDSTTQAHDSLRLERILRGQEAIPLSDQVRDRFKDDVVRPSERIDSLLRYGQDSTINYFFRWTKYDYTERTKLSLSLS